MGAFDGLNLYQSRFMTATPKQQNAPVSQPRFYVCHDGKNHGRTGKWFKSRESAVQFFKKKFKKGLNPAAWFDAPELADLKKSKHKSRK